jgi:hypothetical protein
VASGGYLSIEALLNSISYHAVSYASELAIAVSHSSPTSSTKEVNHFVVGLALAAKQVGEGRQGRWCHVHGGVMSNKLLLISAHDTVAVVAAQSLSEVCGHVARCGETFSLIDNHWEIGVGAPGLCLQVFPVQR